MNNIFPTVSFSHWHKWSDRASIPDITMPGIYAIAITDKDLSSMVFNWADVVYIGMSVAQKGLAGRLGQFERAIISGVHRHSGGRRVFRDLGRYDIKTGKWSNGCSLFVSIQTVECNTVKPNQHDLIKMGQVAYLEYAAFAQYFKQFKSKTKYNKK